MSDERIKDTINNQSEVKKAPPRPPVLPKSYAGAPTINKPRAAAPINQTQVNISAPPAKENNSSEAEVIITKSESKPVHVNSNTYGTTNYSGGEDKRNIVKTLAVAFAVILAVVVLGGVFFLFRDNQPVSADVNIRVIDKPNAGLTNLNSLSKYKSLEELRLYNSGIKNIDGIKNLKSLKIVYLRQNDISDISALKNLENVEYLHLEGNNIKDISALAGLTKLKVLYIGHNQISDLTPLANLTNLEELDLSFNQIVDITPLQNLTKLRKLKLNNNQITNIEALRNLTELRDLFLRENGEIEDLTPLIGMHKMEWCSFNPRNLTLDIIYQLKEANPDAIYYFYYNGDHLYAFDEFVYDPGEFPKYDD